MVAIAGGLVLAGIAGSLLHRLAGFLQIIVISLFLSFAIEPAVAFLAKRGWRRGLATGLVLCAVLAGDRGADRLAGPRDRDGNPAADLLAARSGEQPREVSPAARGSGWTRSTSKTRCASTGASCSLAPEACSAASSELPRGLSAASFRRRRSRLFTFYMVARGPQMRRTVLSRFRPQRQRRILFIWEQAIGQTGGYFYSRLLLAVVNGALMYAVLRWRGVPFAAPLALFEGVVAEFIPVVGTYIAGALPVLVALLYDPVDALIVLIWILVYQQVELPPEPWPDRENDGAPRAGGLRRRADRRSTRRGPVRLPGLASSRRDSGGGPGLRPVLRGRHRRQHRRARAGAR